MDRRLSRLLDLLDSSDEETVGTSMRLPANLRDAAAVAAEMGLAASATDLTVQGLRNVLEAFANLAVLEEHYQQYPEARPSLAEVALAGAQQDGHWLAERPELIDRAAKEIVDVFDDPSPDDVLIYAAGLAAGAA